MMHVIDEETQRAISANETAEYEKAAARGAEGTLALSDDFANTQGSAEAWTRLYAAMCALQYHGTKGEASRFTKKVTP